MKAGNQRPNTKGMKTTKTTLENTANGHSDEGQGETVDIETEKDNKSEWRQLGRMIHR